MYYIIEYKPFPGVHAVTDGDNIVFTGTYWECRQQLKKIRLKK